MSKVSEVPNPRFLLAFVWTLHGHFGHLPLQVVQKPDPVTVAGAAFQLSETTLLHILRQAAVGSEVFAVLFAESFVCAVEVRVRDAVVGSDQLIIRPTLSRVLDRLAALFYELCDRVLLAAVAVDLGLDHPGDVEAVQVEIIPTALNCPR